MELNRNHLAMLKKSCRKTARFNRDTHGPAVDYLSSQKLITFTISNVRGKIIYHVSATEQGKAALYEKVSVIHRANLALLLSLIAILISFLAEFTPVFDYLKELILPSKP